MPHTARRLVLIVIAIGFALTGFGGAMLLAEARSVDQQRHERLASRVRDLLRSRVSVYVYGLRGARGVFSASLEVTRAEFHNYATSREPEFEFPGAIGVGFIRRVPRGALEAFVAERRAEGYADFAIKKVAGARTDAGHAGGANGPPGVAADADPLGAAFVIDYIEPEAFNRDAMGFDIGTEHQRRHAALQAMETGEATLTAPVTLVQAPTEGYGYLYLLPVYRPGPLPETSATRAEALIGWVYMPLVMKRIGRGIGEVADGELDFEIFDGEPETGTLVYDDDAHLSRTTFAEGYEDRELVRRERIALGGRTWTIVASTASGFVHASRLSAWLVIFGGSAFTVVLAWLVFNLAASRGRAERLAAQMTLDLQAKSKELERLSLHDALTGLPNRVLLLDRVQQTLLRAGRDGGLYALMFVDLDDFKRVNDTIGHQGGDQLLKTVAKRLRGALRASDTVSHLDTPNTVARLGGDEFVVLLQRLAAPDDVRLVAARIIERVSAPTTIGEHTVEVGASIGLVIGAERHHSADDLIREADLAMYEAKARGKGSVVVYGEDLAAGASAASNEGAGKTVD
jgi:diguanylate cyclase (GGDEF)-like protein